MRKSVRFSVAAVLAISGLPAAHAIDIAAGDWKVSISGNVNAHYIYSKCEDNPVGIAGGLTCVASDSSSSVSNGLLPAALSISGSTTQGGYDLGFTFGLYPGISTNDGGSPNLQQGASIPHTALGSAGLDVRQVFLTFGNKDMGTVMAGRNIGLFGADAILNDMTLLGVGAGNGSYAAPANTSLGSIGLGYIYTDWLAQINYTTPDIGGAKITLGIFDPLDSLTQAPLNHSSPGFHGKIAYTAGSLYLSGSFLYQQQRLPLCSDGTIQGPTANMIAPPGGGPVVPGSHCADPFATDTSAHATPDAYAFDIGGKYDIAGFEILAWYYRGYGVGTTGLFVLGTDAFGHKRDSDGFLAQVTYKVGPTKFGVNYGESKLDTASGEVAPALVAKNDKVTGGVYYDLTANLMLLGEVTRMESKNQAGGKNTSTNFNVGAFLKF